MDATGRRNRASAFCRACTLNKIIPDMSIARQPRAVDQVEAAKKRALYSLLAFGLPVGPKANPSDEMGIAFDFLADPSSAARRPASAC